MRFIVEAIPAVDGWDVTVHGLAEPNPARRMRKAGEFPQRPDGEAADAAEIRAAFGRIASGTPARGEVASFGRHLFHSLLGDALWQAIRDTAGDELIELALSFPASETDLHRLPWESMHSGTFFLSAEPGRLVAITRLIPGPGAEAATRTVEPRVLFVVGAPLTDPELKPGAEYLGLMRRLEASGLGLSSNLLLQASAERLREAILELRPSIVHFITHGAFSGGQAVLKMVDKDNPGKMKELTAAQLAGILLEPPEDKADGWQGPAIVVLNACYSGQVFGGSAGALPVDRKMKPLAAELVQRGIPLVVGMGGRVADRACRIFTRRFYETILQGDPIRGIAQGRRAGHGEGTSPEDTLDWALPVLFLDPAVTVGVDKDARQHDILRQAAQSLSDYMDHKPAAFCDRLSCMTDYQELVSTGKRARRVMVVYESFDPSRDRKLKYGRTWLLEQLALQAIQNGHAPVLLKLEEGDEPPETLLQLADLIRSAGEQTCYHFGLEAPASSEVVKLKRLQTGAAAGPLPEELEAAVHKDGVDSPAAVRTALRLDLLRLRGEVRKLLRNDLAQILVLVDNLHRAGAVEELLGPQFLKAEGIGVLGDPIPVVFSFCKTDTVTTRTYEALLKHAARNYVIDHRLTTFDSPKVDRMPYEQFLLQLDPPLISSPQPENEQDVQGAFVVMHEIVKGVPSELKSTQLEAFIQYARIRALRPADDEDWLRKQGLLP